ncbi:carbohydrate ABC transporter permease [Kibdelosporangium persicum]|uniref:Binding-protein-dependent transport systems inner membrane component n=1 Tax=Kibdelosporangium persicum TaxID=2698649 RepID=A0ABX2F6T8_9PSEU|nr:sugar ABC transporter permease [Kibdelosporangium persicum]NRN67073.1 Binding-protein-dependent transport systems inner membrane component [Kibdelosporangium persicum]
MTVLKTPPSSATAAPAPRKPRGAGRRREHQREAYVFLTPWLLGAIGLTVGPMIVSLYLSFTEYDLFTEPRWVGFENFVRMFTEDDRYLQSVKVTLLYVLVAVPMKMIVSLLVAMVLNTRAGSNGFYRSAFYAPSLLGASVAAALVWRAMFTEGGTVNELLDGIGLNTPSWVDDPSYTIWSVILLAVWQFGAPMVIFLAGLKQIPRELYEAAEVDGASPVRKFWHITLPMLSPVIFFNLVLEAIHAFQVFTPAFVIGGGRGGPADSALVYTLYLYQAGFEDFEMGYASAMAWVLLVVIAIVTAVIFRSARLWVFYGDKS